MATAVYWRRLGFRGSSGFGAEVRNGLGRPTASDVSAACPLRLFPPGLRCAPAQPPMPPPRVAPRWDLGIGLLRLGSGISVRAGRAGPVTSGDARGSREGGGVAAIFKWGRCGQLHLRSSHSHLHSCRRQRRRAKRSTWSRGSQTEAGSGQSLSKAGALPRGCAVQHFRCPIANPENPLAESLVEVN